MKTPLGSSNLRNILFPLNDFGLILTSWKTRCTLLGGTSSILRTFRAGPVKKHPVYCTCANMAKSSLCHKWNCSQLSITILTVELYFLSIESPLSLVSVGIQIQIGFGILRPLQFRVGFIKTVSYCNVSSSLLILISLFCCKFTTKKLTQSAVS